MESRTEKRKRSTKVIWTNNRYLQFHASISLLPSVLLRTETLSSIDAPICRSREASFPFCKIATSSLQFCYSDVLPTIMIESRLIQRYSYGNYHNIIAILPLSTSWTPHSTTFAGWARTAQPTCHIRLFQSYHNHIDLLVYISVICNPSACWVSSRTGFVCQVAKDRVWVE